jgi:cation/acetate symporter
MVASRMRRMPGLPRAPTSEMNVTAISIFLAFVATTLMITARAHRRGIPDEWAVVLVGALLTLYVVFGGMVATTWIQIVKASLLLLSALVMSVVLLHRFGYSFVALTDAAAATGRDPNGFLHTQGLLNSRFDAVRARISIVYASSLIVIFQFLVIVLGIGSVALVSNVGHFSNGGGALVGGANMAAVYLAWYLGGNPLFGFVAAVTFVTILAVVSGLTFERGEVRTSREAAALVGCWAIAAGIAFRHQNIGFLATLPLVLAACSNFPILLLSMYWRRLTTSGAVAGGLTGLLSTCASRPPTGASCSSPDTRSRDISHCLDRSRNRVMTRPRHLGLRQCAPARSLLLRESQIRLLPNVMTQFEQLFIRQLSKGGHPTRLSSTIVHNLLKHFSGKRDG